MKFNDYLTDLIFKETEFNAEWYKGSQKEFNSAYTLLLEIYDNLNSSHLIQDSKLYLKTDDIYQTVISAMFCKTYKTYQCIMMNLHMGFSVDSSNLTRSLMEALVNILFISQKQRKRRAKRFIDYKIIEDIKLMWGFENYLGRSSIGRLSVKQSKIWHEHKQKYWNVRRKFLFTNKKGKVRLYPSWSKETFSEKCKDVGLDYYKGIVYWKYSSSEHSGPSSVIPSISKIDQIHKFLHYLPKGENVEEIISESSKFITLIFFIFASNFNLLLSKKFKEAHKALINHEDFKVCFQRNRALRNVNFW